MVIKFLLALIQLAQRHQSPESVRRSWFQGAAHFAAKGVPDLVPKVALVSIASLSAIFSQMAYPVFSIKDSSNFDSENAPCLCVERALASHQKARPVLFQVRIPYCSRGYSHFSLKMPFAFQQRPPFGSRALCRLGPRGIPCIRSKGASRCSSNGFPSFGFKGRSRSACNCVPCLASNGIPRFVPMVSQAPAPTVFPVPAPIASSALAPRVRFASNVPCLSGFQ